MVVVSIYRKPVIIQLTNSSIAFVIWCPCKQALKAALITEWPRLPRKPRASAITLRVSTIAFYESLKVDIAAQEGNIE